MTTDNEDEREEADHPEQDQGNHPAEEAVVCALYDLADRERGWIESEDRTGHSHRTPLVSLSIGIVMSKPGNFSSAPALASRAAEVKGVAKRIPGSKWVVDRRRPPEARHR